MLTTLDSDCTDSCFLLRQILQQQEAPSALLYAALHCWMDGILILTANGQVVHQDDSARTICDRLFSETCNTPLSIPQAIWEICALLQYRHERSPNQQHIVESEISLAPSHKIRVRVRQFEFGAPPQSYLLVLLEDQQQSKQNLAIAEVDQYHLSPREAEVWTLRRSGYSLKRISTELCISINTVKKHLKAIREKQQAALF